MLRFSAIPLRNLRRRPLRAALTVLGVATAVAGYATLTGLGRGVEESWSRSLRAYGTDILAYRKGSLDILAGALDQAFASDLRKVDGVAFVEPELVDMVTLEGGASVLVRGWEAEGELWRSSTLLSGRRPKPGGGGEVVVGKSLADALDLKPGDVIRPFGTRLVIVGVMRLEGTLNNHSVIAPLVDLQQLLDRKGKVTVFNIGLRSDIRDQPAGLSRMKERLSQAFPRLGFLEARTATQSYELYRLWRGMAWATSLVGLAMGMVIVLNTLLVAVLERNREIGVLLAVGWSRGRVLALVMIEGLMLAVPGGVLGLASAAFALNALSHHPKLRGFIAVIPSPEVMAQQLVVAVVLGLAAAVYPAWRATRLDPVDVLRDA